jgi:hypothetical protein
MLLSDGCCAIEWHAGKPNKMLWQVEIKGLQKIYQVISNFVSSNLKVSIVHSQFYFSLR